MSIDIGSILSRAWKITWNHKVLWIFGILAALASGGGGGNNPLNYQLGSRDFGQGPGELPPGIERFFERLFNEPAIVALVIGLACLAVLIAVALFVLSIIGRGGLIGGAQLADAKGSVTFGEAWAVGVRRFWTLFLIGLVVGIASLVVGGISIIAILTICLIPLACVGFLVVAVLGVIAYFAQIAAVTENLSVGAALSRAWEIIRANFGSIIVLGLILIIASAVAGFVLALPILAIVGPVAIAVALRGEEVLRNSLIVAGVFLVVYVPVLIVLRGVLETWVTSAWTLAYQRFTRPAAAPDVSLAPQA